MRVQQLRHTVELTSQGFMIRQPDGTLYNGIWRARRIARLACDSLNAGQGVQPGQKPDRLVVLVR